VGIGPRRGLSFCGVLQNESLSRPGRPEKSGTRDRQRGSQEPRLARGAWSWFHSKYAVTDGVSAGWYCKMYYLNDLGGASVVLRGRSLANQWMLPGQGTHPIQLPLRNANYTSLWTSPR
jgi:hypothetical protein